MDGVGATGNGSRAPPARLRDVGATLAGEPLGFAAAIITVKGDWSEYVHAFGFPSWGTHRSPCLFCDCTGGPAGNIRNYAGTSATTLPWRLKDAASYEAACQACEVSVRVTTQDQLRRLALVCPFDKRIRAPALLGRGLRGVGFGELGLTKGTGIDLALAGLITIIEITLYLQML